MERATILRCGIHAVLWQTRRDERESRSRVRTLVTGGAGYIGSVIVEELQRTGHTPIVYDSFVKGHRAALPEGIAILGGL